jgi:hypothetical protein
MGATLDLEVNGDDEQNALAEVEEVFAPDSGPDSDMADTGGR